MSERGGQNSFDPTDYWEERLFGQLPLGSVGVSPLGEGFDEWSYAVRDASSSGCAPRTGRKADANVRMSGRGRASTWPVAAPGWAATSRSRPHRGRRRTHGAALSVDDAQRDGHRRSRKSRCPSAYDAVSIVDVLFVIVDDDRYVQALSNLSRWLTAADSDPESEPGAPAEPYRSSGHAEQAVDPLRPGRGRSCCRPRAPDVLLDEFPGGLGPAAAATSGGSW